LIISVDQELFSCGHSDHHGHKIKEHLSKPKKLSISDEKIVTAAAGFNHALAVTQKGQTYSWGNGVFYQLGHNSKNDEKEPRLIKKLADVRIAQVSCTRG
jgi:alpha-tubulin suppressor-like RCC1 family protein